MFWLQRVLLSALFICAASGCGGGNKEWNPTDADHVLKTVSEISDARSDPEKLNSLFVPGSEPDEAWLAEANKYMLIVAKADVSGDTATATVELEDTMEGTIVRTHTWQCERIDGEWKIKDAPLQ